MTPIPFIPESAPFNAEQRAWLNGFLAGLFSQVDPGKSPASEPAPSVPGAGPLLVLYGSQSGSAEGLARRLAEEAGQRGFAPKVKMLNDCPLDQLAQGGRAVLVTSTWGDGELPDNAAEFWNQLRADSAPRMEQLSYAVLGLGDKNYADFCGAAKKLDARLESLGARRLTDRGECDSDYEAAAKAWTSALWQSLQAAAAPPAPAPSPAAETKPVPAAPAYSRARPFSARLLRNVLLNRPGSGKEVRHYELSLEGSGLTYEVGDALGVVPVNCPELVEDLIAALKCTGAEPVEVENSSLPLREALAKHFDITKPTPGLLEWVGARAFASGLSPLLAPERRDDLKRWVFGRDILDVIGLMPAPVALAELLPLLRKLSPRLYSISSSPRAHPGEVHLTVGAVRYESHGRARKGVASTFLADRVHSQDFVKVFVQPSGGFKTPSDGRVPMVMVGPGTGIAPFRAFLEDRQATGASGRNWLFFGDKTRAGDFLYEEQLSAWLKDGFLTRLDLAFSRDQPQKIYVQDRMREQGPELWTWLESGAHFYVCGDAARMAKDVDAALHQIIEQHGGKSPDEAKAYVAAMKSAKRYQRDVY